MKRGDAEDPRVAFAFLGLLVIVFLLLFFAPWGAHGSILVSDLAYVLCAGIATVFGIIATRRYGIDNPLGKSIFLFTLGVGFNFLAGAIWGAYEVLLGVASPFPSVADLLWTLFYISVFFALLNALKNVWNNIPITTKAIITILWLLVVLTTYSAAIAPVLGNADATLVEKLASIQYPVGSLITIFLCTLLFSTLRRGVFGEAWFAGLLGLVLHSAATIFFSHAVIHGTFQTGGIIDTLWFAGQLLWAYAFYKDIALADA